MNIDPAFAKYLSYLDLEDLGRSADVIYIIDDTYRLRAFNQAWIEFARNNDGEAVLKDFPLGSVVSEAAQGPIRSFIEKSYRKALVEHTPFAHSYVCSSASSHRVFRQTAYPLVGGAGLVVSHHLLIKKPHVEEATEFNNRFTNENGTITQCANCRKIRDPKNPTTWYWVPSMVRNPHPMTSHSICGPCLDHYYPDIAG